MRAQRGSVARSTCGCSAILIPTATYSWRAMSPNSSTSAGSPVAPRPIGSGHCVEHQPDLLLERHLTEEVVDAHVERLRRILVRIEPAVAVQVAEAPVSCHGADLYTESREGAAGRVHERSRSPGLS